MLFRMLCHSYRLICLKAMEPEECYERKVLLPSWTELQVLWLKPCYVDNWTYELTTCSNLCSWLLLVMQNLIVYKALESRVAVWQWLSYMSILMRTEQVCVLLCCQMCMCYMYIGCTFHCSTVMITAFLFYIASPFFLSTVCHLSTGTSFLWQSGFLLLHAYLFCCVYWRSIDCAMSRVFIQRGVPLDPPPPPRIFKC